MQILVLFLKCIIEQVSDIDAFISVPTNLWIMVMLQMTDLSSS